MKNEQEFKIGDTVRLNSGSPLMTIRSLKRHTDPSNDSITCIYFDNDNNLIEVNHLRFEMLYHSTETEEKTVDITLNID